MQNDDQRKGSGNDEPNQGHRKTSGEQIEIRLPVLRESTLPTIFPLSDCIVNFPVAQTSFMNTVMYYKIDFTWKGEQKSISRRHSDISALRYALQAHLPFTYISPTHRKQLIVL